MDFVFPLVPLLFAEQEGVTALILAAAAGNMDMLRLLLDRGANLAMATEVTMICNCGWRGGQWLVGWEVSVRSRLLFDEGASR